MVLEGKLFVANRTVEIKKVEYEEQGESFSRDLDGALVKLCREMNIPYPLWMQKNTKEFAAFRQTIFFAEQFTEQVGFDRFQIRQLS